MTQNKEHHQMSVRLPIKLYIKTIATMIATVNQYLCPEISI